MNPNRRSNILRIGTRRSLLAKAQTNWVREELISRYPELQIEIVEVLTTGDRILDAALSKVPGKGLFVKEIEEKLLTRDIDLAVHSMKDVPTEFPAGLGIAAMTERVDPRDVLVTRRTENLADLPSGARIGTSSLRRQAQLLTYRNDLHIVDIRGNIDTRLKKSETEEYDGILLAAAGLHRMGWSDRVHEYLSCDVMVPAVGQGALGLETRLEDAATNHYIECLNDAATQTAVEAERVFLAGMGGGCQAPMGAYCRVAQHDISFKAFHANPEGTEIQRTEMTGRLDGATTIAHMVVEAFRNKAYLV